MSKRWMVYTAILMFCVSVAFAENWPIVNVKTDLARKGIYKTNARGDAKTDDTLALQAAIDYVRANGGGFVYVPKGVYCIKGIKVYDTVTFSGKSRDKTIFRGIDSSYAAIEVHGGTIMNFTVYGTPSISVSGKHWKIGKDGKGRGSTAKPLMLIAVLDANNATICNVRAIESRYDCLYIRTCKNLKVINCRFDRAGRNIVSIVGNSDEFIFSGCHIGSLWGLYLFDIEPNKGDFYVRNGVIHNCIFDGSKAGQMGSDTWGSFFCFSGDEKLRNRNISIIGCQFKNIYVRVRGIFPNVKFIDNTFDVSRAFVKIHTNPTGEFRDALVAGNKFMNNGKPAKEIISGVTFTGKSSFVGNFPSKFNHIKIASESKKAKWVEYHPVDAYSKIKKQLKPGTVITQGNVKIVSMPLCGNEFRFSDAKILKPSSVVGRDTNSKASGDIAIHIEPIIALGNAKITKLGFGTIEDYISKIPEQINWEKKAFNLQAGQVYLIKTKDDKTVLFEIISFNKKQIQFRYRFVTTIP